jgi:multidrug efflux pump subunit AcrA (membrane-fusion protein)
MPITDTQAQTQLLCNELRYVVSHRPAWIIRNGIVILFLIIISLFSFTFFISYPDTVTARVKISAVNPPKEIKTKTDGRLIRLFVKENQKVSVNETIAYLESHASYDNILKLDSVIDLMQSLLESGNLELLPMVSEVEYDSLGETQTAFQIFVQALSNFRQYLSSGFYLQKKKMLGVDLKYLEIQKKTLIEQRRMMRQDVNLAKQTYNANTILKDENVISSFDYRNETSKLINKSISIPQITLLITNNESSQHEKQKEIAELENTIRQQKTIFLQALNTFKAGLEEWKSKYLLKSPIDGRVIFSGFFQDNQLVSNNKTICFINPPSSSFFAEIFLPQNNFGKIKTGQRVIIKMASYPYQEFGILNGSLDFISHIASDSGYAAKVNLPQGLITTYGKQILFNEGLTASGEIITADLKLSDRIFNQLKSIFKNR